MELAFSKRECNRYVPNAKDVARCSCGQTWGYHKTHGIEAVAAPGELWSPSRHTASTPTDAFGTIDFLGGSPYVTLTLPYVTLRYLTLPYVTLRYLTLPYVTLRYLTLPYVTLRYITLPYVTLRYLTLPYLTLR